MEERRIHVTTRQTSLLELFNGIPYSLMIILWLRCGSLLCHKSDDMLTFTTSESVISRVFRSTARYL